MKGQKNKKTPKSIERHIKGMANHWRIKMILFIEENEGASLDEIVESLDMNIKTASEHARKLYQAGLVNKKYAGRVVEHSLSPYGKFCANFIKKFLTTF